MRTSNWVLFGVLAGSLAIAGCDDGDGGGGVDPADMGSAGGEGGTGGGEGGMGGDGGEGGGVVPDGLSIPGMDGPVTVRFDARSQLNVDCTTDADCFAVQGYYHASHRFIQMDIRRRFVRGTLSEMVGVATLDTDKENRFRIAGRSGERVEERMWAQASPETREAVEAYTRGVNAWLYDYRNGRNGAVLNDEYEFALINKDAITDWTPEDSAACILALIQQLTDHSGIEIGAGASFAAYDPALAADFFGLVPATSATVLPTSKAGPQRAFEPWQLDSIHARMLQAQSLFAQVPQDPQAREKLSAGGSNNWVVGPQRSADGRALLANDPHLALSNAAIWYLVNLDAKTNGTGDIHIAGASFAGLPGVVLGQNEDIAWGATTTYFDMADVYIETLSADGTGVIFNGETVPFVEQVHTFKVDKADDVNETRLYVPHHGPVVAIDREAGTAMTIKWTGQDASTDLNFIQAINRASSVDGAKAAIGATVTTVGQNFVFIDREGGFGWFPYNTIPNRPWASAELPSWLPLPGDGSAEWEGYLPADQVPQAQNPATGYIATANNDMTGALRDGDPTNDGLPMLQHYVANGFRQAQVQARIEAEATHTVESMQSIQSDVYSLMGAQVVPAMLALVAEAELTDDAQKVAGALAAWDFQCSTGLAGTDPEGEKGGDAAASIGCTAFHATWPNLVRAAFLDDLVPELGGAPEPSALVRLLLRPEGLQYAGDYWDDRSTEDVVETAQMQMAKALDDAGIYLAEEMGADVDDWRWGRVHTLTLRADLFDAAGVESFNSEAVANDGGLFTVDVANPRGIYQNNFSHSAGASMRFACGAGADGVDCTIELPGGQRLFRDSPNYLDYFENWLTNTPVPLLFKADDVSAAATETLTIAPR